MSLVIVSGALGSKPFNGGNAWSRLSWVLGFQELGYEVLFLEQVTSQACANEAGQPCPFQSSANLAYFKSVMDSFGLANRAAMICDGGEQIWGLALETLKDSIRDAVVLFNMGGHLTIPELKALAKCKVFYDDDPGYTQIWHAQGLIGSQLAEHDFYYTIGENIGTGCCNIPSSGIHWQTTRVPVVLSFWPAVRTDTFDRFTTVSSWRGAYGAVQFEGRTYGLKAHEFRKFSAMPRLTGREFEIALNIDPADQKDRDMLVGQGWALFDPVKVASTPDSFQQYVQTSAAEFSVAQGIYVETNSGWFSDRTVRYLASGRPALVQETGFSGHLPVGKGIVPFRTIEEAVEGVNSITADYEEHCKAARRICEDSFAATKVIRQLTSEIGVRK
jgi:hypothetical protein